MKLLMEAESDYETRSAVVLLARVAAADKKRKLRLKLREPICNIVSRDDGYDAEVVAGVDLTIVALFCYVLHQMVTTRAVFKDLVADDQVASATVL